MRLINHKLVLLFQPEYKDELGTSLEGWNWTGHLQVPFNLYYSQSLQKKEGENFDTSVVCGLVGFVVVYFLFEAVLAILKNQRPGCERGIPYL